MCNYNYGGNILTRINMDLAGRHDFATGEYIYFSYLMENSEELVIEHLSSFTIAPILDGKNKTELYLLELDQKVEPGDVIQAENHTVTLRVSKTPARLLVAGTQSSTTAERNIKYIKGEDVYKVTKPWGHELWLSMQHPGYAFKAIFIKQGTKTSLQYHRKKKETNVLYSGKAILNYKKNIMTENDDVHPDDLDTVLVESLSAIDISPLVLHRLEAITDVLLYETSTPHLDDVIRVQDDSNRANGRINAEHRS